MDPELLGTLSTAFFKSHVTNSTASSFASKIPTITEPTGDGVIKLTDVENAVENNLLIVPYGTASDNHTFNMRIIGWREVLSNVAGKSLWVPVILAELACTHCAAVGVAGSPVVAAERFVDTITLTTGNSGISIEVFSPGSVAATADLIGHVVVDAKGFKKIEITFDLGSGTDLNALCAKY